jgi:spermidine synthase
VTAGLIATAAAASACLFLVELVAGKALLPLCGGAPAVWITCLAFFQVMLVAAYIHAARQTRRHSPGHQVVVQAAVLAAGGIASCGVLATGLARNVAADWPVGVRVLLVLSITVGPAFFALATLAPLFGHWRSHWPAGEDERGRASYALYAAGNAGSFAALVAYPLLIESRLGLSQQVALAGLLYAAVAALTGVYGSLTARRGAGRSTAGGRPHPASVAPAAGWHRWLRWALLAAIPSSWLAGVTTYATVEVAPLPLLWVVPLAAYLLSFAVVFSPGGRRWSRQEPGAVLVATGLAAWLVAANVTAPTWPVIAAHIAALFVTGIGIHGMLVDERPPVADQPTFYLALAVGGAAGGLFNAVVAPLVFDAHYEFPLAIVAAAGVPALSRQRGLWVVGWAALAAIGVLLVMAACYGGIADWTTRTRWLMLIGTSLTAMLAACGPRIRSLALAGVLAGTFALTERVDGVIHRSRTFFGVLRVCDSANGPSRTLMHGGITHGVQLVSEDPTRRRIPLSYYAEAGPLGSIFQGLAAARPIHRVGVAGLGIGTVATYAAPGQEFVFFEIDPQVVRIARDTRWFSFLADCRGAVRVVEDDARLALAREPEGALDLLVIDAFTGDSVPTHLLPREAFALYGRTLAADGILALHVSNKYLDFVPMVEAVAADGGWMGIVARDMVKIGAAARIPSEWMALSRSLETIKEVYARPTSDRWQWRPCAEAPTVAPWTDDRTAVIEALWHRRALGSAP